MIGRKQIKSGMTVLETLFVIALLSLIVVAIAPYFRTTVEGWQVKDRQLEILQNARVGIDEIAKAVRSATDFNSLAANSMVFNTTGNVTVGFRLTGDVLEKQVSGTWTAVAEPLDSLAFTYYDKEGAVTANATDVRSVKIAMNISDSENKISPVTFNSQVVLRKDIPVVSYSLAINEINYNPVVSKGQNERDKEWVEVYNFGPSSLDLNNWTIADSTVSDTISGWSGGSTVIPAGGYGVIVGSQSTVFASYTVSPTAVKLVTDDNEMGNGLGNNSDTITIADADGVIADLVTYDDDWGGDGNGDTIERKDHTTAPSTASNWEASSAHSTYTCGAANTVGP